MIVNELQRKEQILADRSPESELNQRLECDLRIGSMNSSKNADGLGADVDAGQSMTAGVPKCSTENRHLDRTLGRRAAAEAGTMDRRGDVKLIIERGDSRGLRILRKKDGSKERIADTSPVEGAVDGVASGDFFRGDMFVFAIAEAVELRAAVRLGVILIAESTRPV